MKVFGAKLGLIVLESNDLVKNLHSLAKVPADVVASELLNLLGFKEGKTIETSEYNLVCVYVGDGGRVSGEKNKAVARTWSMPMLWLGI